LNPDPSAVPDPAAPDAATAAPAAERAEYVWLYEKRKRIYARAVSGWFAGWRWALVWATQLLFYGLPWLEWNARQAVLFDLEARRFYLFGLVLYPQDFIYLTALLIISAYALFLFTAVAGRLWCGYACPQTVYSEIFMWVERRIQGDRAARMKRDAGPWSAERLGRAAAKHAAWLAIALWTGLTFVGYFTPIRELLPAAVALDLGPWQTFWVLFYGFATYGNAGFLREQVCIYMCPYARFQGAMFDRDTLIITYDERRGEPRGSRSRKADPRAAGQGDCIDCDLCVQVCPTGIDIRKGQQYECIGCAACVDVCNSVMDKMNYPRGLVRYTTLNGLTGQWSPQQMWRRVLRPRVLVYSAVLVLVVGALAYSLATRSPLAIDVVRDRAVLARLVERGHIENVYRLQIRNVTERDQRYAVRVQGIDGAVVDLRGRTDLGPVELRWVPLAVRVPPEAAQALGPGAHRLVFVVERVAADGDAAAVVMQQSTFVVPR
jgi:cytochrome c oxidase accessory protein FixG